MNIDKSIHHLILDLQDWHEFLNSDAALSEHGISNIDIQSLSDLKKKMAKFISSLDSWHEEAVLSNAQALQHEIHSASKKTNSLFLQDVLSSICSTADEVIPYVQPKPSMMPRRFKGPF